MRRQSSFVVDDAVSFRSQLMLRLDLQYSICRGRSLRLVQDPARHLISDGQFMLSECFNPACRKELRYLRSGKVVMVLRRGTERTEVEHFWLCGACYVSYVFRCGEDGNPSLITKSSVQIARDLDRWLDRTPVAPTQPAARRMEWKSVTGPVVIRKR